MRGRLLLLLLTFLFTGTAFANDKPVTMQLAVDDSATHFILNIKIKDGWKIYGPYWSKEGKPISMNTDGSSNVSALYLSWPEPKYNIELQDTDNSYYGELNIPLSVDANLEEEVQLQLNVSVVACKDMCMQINETLRAGADIKAGNDYVKLLFSVLMALAGGFILNFMPCVLPVVVLKAYSIAKYSGESRKSIYMNGVCTSLGILTAFICLAFIVVFMRSIGNSMGWGMHFQQPAFIIFIIIAVFISAMMMNGDLSLSIRGENLANGKSGYMASFFSGVLSTILSTPCTAPFITSAIAFALTQKAHIIILIYCSMGVGMALPFLLISLSPNMVKILPKPGAWMEYLKKVFGLLMLMTVVWLLYVLNNQLGIKSTVLVCGGLVLLKFCLMQLAGWKKWLAATLVIGCMMAVPSEVSKKDALRKQWADAYWEPFSMSELRRYTEQGNLVLVDITAEWCVLCKVNKFLVLDNIAVLEFLKMHNVKMLRGDFTSFSPEVDIYMKQEQRNGIPYNIIYGPRSVKKITFPEILTAKMIYKAVHDLEK